MNLIPIAHLLQWQAQLAIDRGVPVIYNARQLHLVQVQELEAIING